MGIIIHDWHVYVELKHLMEGTLLKLRQFLIESRCLSDNLLLKPTLIVQPPNEDDEDQIEQLESIKTKINLKDERKIFSTMIRILIYRSLYEGLAHQWIYVVTYSLELRDYYSTCGTENSHPTIQAEINSLLHKCSVLFLTY